MCEMIEVDRNIVIVPRVNDIGAPLQCLEESDVAPCKRVPAKRFRAFPMHLFFRDKRPTVINIYHELISYGSRCFHITGSEKPDVSRTLAQQLERMRNMNCGGAK